MYYKSILSNGVRLLTVPAKNTKAVTVLVLLPVGSRYESLSLTGASHFIEHMIFKGTRQRPSNLAIAKELDGIGAEYNAFTGKEYTGYWIKTIKEKMNVGFDVLSDIIFNSVFDMGEFQREKGVILQEIKMYQENPLLYISDFFDHILYGKHPLGKLISGPMNAIKKMSRKNLLSYKEKFYQPSQMLIAVCGNIRKPEIVDSVEKYFGGHKGARKKSKYLAFKKTSAQLKHRVGILFKNVDQVQIALGGFAYPYNHRQIEVLDLLLIILGGNMSSRLFTEVRVKRGLAYFVRTYSETYKDTGAYVIRAGVDKEKVLETLKVILHELEKIKKNGVSVGELRRAKDYFNGILKLSIEDSANLVGWYAKQLLMTNKIISPKQKLQKIKRVTCKDIQGVARQLFFKQGLNLGLIGPFRNKNPFLRILQKSI